MSNENTALFALENCTLAALIESGAEYLDSSDLVYGHGTDNPLDESAWLALEACGLSPAEPLESYEIPVTAAQLQQAQRWFRLRAGQQIPVAYITGRSWFAGLEFVTDPRALIPRSPIAELIANEFQPWLVKPPAAVLDLCCGGGCIAIATAVAFPSALVHASDLSADALQLAEINRARHGLEQLQLFQGDLFEPLPGGQRYDLSLPMNSNTNRHLALPLVATGWISSRVCWMTLATTSLMTVYSSSKSATRNRRSRSALVILSRCGLNLPVVATAYLY